MICIIQARENSTRLNNKMLKKINKEYIIEWVIKRCKKIKRVDKVLLAIPNNNKQKKLLNVVIWFTKVITVCNLERMDY